MTKTQTLSITEARSRIFDLTDQVARMSSYFTLTDNGRAKAVLMSADEFDSWMETLETMRDIPNLSRDLLEIEQDRKTGVYKKYPTLDEAETNLLPYQTSKRTRTYGVRRSNKTKRAKSV